MLLLEYDPFYSIAVDSARHHRKTERANERQQYPEPDDSIVFETPPHEMCQEMVMEIIYRAIHYSEQHVKGCAPAGDCQNPVFIPEISAAGRMYAQQYATIDIAADMSVPESMKVVQELVDVSKSIVKDLLNEMTELVEGAEEQVHPLADVIEGHSEIQPLAQTHVNQDTTTAAMVDDVETLLVNPHVFATGASPELDAPQDALANAECLHIADGAHSSPLFNNADEAEAEAEAEEEEEAEAEADAYFKKKYMLPEEQQKEFEARWQSRKASAEAAAESNARVTFRQWQRDRVTLEQAIDTLLKDYAEIYERAHALRLLFEDEKAQWGSKIQQETMQARMQERAQVRAEESPRWDVKRQRTDTWGSAFSYPHQQHQRQHNQVSPYSFAFPHSQPRGALVDEFQYAVEDSQEHEQGGIAGSGVEGQAALLHSDMCGLSPHKKQQKKFTVPVKMT